MERKGPVSFVTRQVGKEPFVGTGKCSTVRCEMRAHCSVAPSCPTRRPHGLQHTRLPCPSPTPGAYSKSCPLCRWCHPTFSSSVAPFSSSSHLQSFPASGSFSMSWFFTSGAHCWWVPNEVWDVSWRQGNQNSILNLSTLFISFKNTYFKIYFWLCWVLLHGLSLVATSRGYSLLQCVGFFGASRCRAWALQNAGFSSCGVWAQYSPLLSSRAQAQ